MSRPGRRMFGPLFYTTATAAVFVIVCVNLQAGWPVITGWLRERSLMRALRSDDWQTRASALAAVAKTDGPRAVPYLLEAAHDSRPELRALACRHLVEAGGKPGDVIRILVAAANDAEPKVRQEAAMSLGGLVRGGVFRSGAAMGTTWHVAGPDARTASVQALRRLLKDEGSVTRIMAADALGQLDPDAETVADLTAATGDIDREVRFVAARALLRLKGANDPVAGRTLISLVADPEPIANRVAILDVVKTASDEVQDQAAAALAGLLNDDDLAIDADVIECVAAMGPRARLALPALERALDDDDPTQRATVAIAYATIAGKSAPRALQSLLKVVADLSIATEWRRTALGKIQELDEASLTKATPILIRQLGSKNLDVRLDALQMLSIVSEVPAEMPGPNEAK